MYSYINSILSRSSVKTKVRIRRLKSDKVLNFWSTIFMYMLETKRFRINGSCLINCWYSTGLAWRLSLLGVLHLCTDKSSIHRIRDRYISVDRHTFIKTLKHYMAAKTLTSTSDILHSFFITNLPYIFAFLLPGGRFCRLCKERIFQVFFSWPIQGWRKFRSILHVFDLSAGRDLKHKYVDAVR